jgi:hypothetical protein
VAWALQTGEVMPHSVKFREALADVWAGWRRHEPVVTRRLVALLALLVLLAPAAALAQEIGTCTGEEEVGAVPVVIASVPPGPHWADVVLAGVVLVLGGVLVLRVRAVGRRRAEGTQPPPADAAPVVAGGLLGALFAGSELIFGKPVGASGAFSALVRGDILGWPVWIVVGVIAGSLASAVAARQFQWSVVPAAWRARHGPSTLRRFAVTFSAAALMELAAAIAGGCTSGLALSGGIGLAPGAFVFMAAMFATGMPAAWLAHGRKVRP